MLESTDHTAARTRAIDLPAGRWILDPDRSWTSFAIDYNSVRVTAAGRFVRMTGELTVEPDGAASGELKIDSRSCAPELTGRDEYERAAIWVVAAAHPLITFIASGVRALAGGSATIDGTLMVADRAEPVSVPLKVDRRSGELFLAGKVTIDRSVYGPSGRPAGLASSDVTVTIEARLHAQR
jgi:polyisoprenoid-binding protein YceI